MKLTFHTLDVFTTEKFGGNPLAVVLGADDLTTDQMQAITREFNLSETTFVMRPRNPAHAARVRIFFPGGEMPFAGHPTLGTAALLADLMDETGGPFETELVLELAAGLTPVKLSRNANVIRGVFTAPVVPFIVPVRLPTREEAARAINLHSDDIGFDGHGMASIEGGPRFFYIPVKNRAALERSKVIEPFWSDMLKLVNGGKSGSVDAAYLYTRGGDGASTHFRARMYSPTGGIPEDPATGSATALLAAQLLVAENLLDGTHEWALEQGYEMGRPSNLALQADVEAGQLNSVRVGGSAVRMMSGVLKL